MSEQPAPVTGSATARAILRRALQSGQVFMIEDHSGSPAVNFGQLDEGLRYEQTKPGCLTSVLIWRVRLDLSDFRRVHAPASVRESFDLGFTLLHELLHGLGYEDAKEAAQLGGCETLLNQARAELGLPQRAEYLGVAPDFNEHLDLHIHVPEGAIPKDGPSAGITMATAITSALTRFPVRRDVAMTGEITLRGKVLPVGGIKEKVLAAHRSGIRTVILPRDNEKDLADIPPDVQADLEIVLVSHMDEVLPRALERPPTGIGMVSAGTKDQPRAH